MSCASNSSSLEQLSATEHAKLRSLQEAGTWPNASQAVVVNLIGQFSAYERYPQAQRYFQDRVANAETPQKAWFLAAEGLFQIRNNESVPLLERTAFVEEGVAKLDEAVSIERGLANYIRGAVLVNLPESFGELDRGIDDLNFVLSSASFPEAVKRGALKELANAYQKKGDDIRARDFLTRSGQTGAPEEVTLTTDFSVAAEAGFRFGVERLTSIGENIWLAQGYDFGDIAFIETPSGIVVIDAGTHVGNAQKALADLRALSQAPLRTLVLTHAHWDHIGGAAAFVDEGAEVIVESHFDEEREATRFTEPLPFRWFFGSQTIDLDVRADRVIDVPVILEGERAIELIPVKGGETHDALLVHLPDERLVFTGDVFMPYLGAPFTEEGDPESLLSTIDRIVALNPRRLIHGHAPLTRLWTIEELPVLRAALASLIEQVNTNIKEGKALHETLMQDILPASLIENPNAVMPFVVMREGVIKRLYDLKTGYWQPDGAGVETLSPDDWGRALALSAGEEGIIRGAEALLASGEGAMPLELIRVGLRHYEDSEKLKALKKRALQRMRSVNHQSNPFKFIVYSEEANIPLAPVRLDP